MLISVVQVEPKPDAKANIKNVSMRIKKAAENGSDLVVLPEIWNIGYFDFESYVNKAEPLDGPILTHLCDLAAELDIYIHTGSIVEDAGDELYNTSGIISPNGNLLDFYRKIHLFGHESRERDLLTSGERIVAVDTDFGTVGLTTCFDLRFPELYQSLSNQGVELMLVTSAWPDARVEHWQILNRVRALETQTFLAASNSTGTNCDVELAGQSLIIDPWGIPLANAGVSERTISTHIDLKEVQRVRKKFPILSNKQLKQNIII